MSNDTIGADAELNLNRWTSNVETMAGDVTRLEDLLGGMAEASADTTSAFEEMYEALSDDIEINLDTAALDELEGIDTDIAIDIEVTPTEDSQETIDWLGVFAKVQLLKMGLEFIGAGVDLVKQLAEWAGVGIILDVGEYGARFTALSRLPESFDHMAVAFDIYTGKFGDYGNDLNEVYSVMTELARRAGDGITEAQLLADSLSVFQAANILGQGWEPTLNILDQIVRTGFADDLAGAADLLTVGFLESDRNARDFQMTVQRMLPDLQGLGFDGDEAMALIVTGTQNAAGRINELTERFSELGYAFDNLQWREINDLVNIGFWDETQAYLAGEMTGGQWIDGLVNALSTGEGRPQWVNEAQARQSADRVVEHFFGAGAEMQDILSLRATDVFDDVEGTAARTSNQINDHWRSAWNGLIRFIETETARFFDGAFDMSGRIDDAKDAIGRFFMEIERGEGVFQAIEVAFNLPGLEGILQGFQTAMADAAIGIMNAVAWLMGVIPGTGGASDFLREGAMGLSRLQADIEFGRIVNEDDVVDAVRRSATRGLEGGEIAQRLVDSFEGASPDIQRAIIDASRLAFQEVDVGFVVGRGMVSEWRESSSVSRFLGEEGQAIVTAAAFEEALAGVVRQSEIASSVIGLTGDSMLDWRTNTTTAAGGVDTLADAADDAVVPVTNLFRAHEEWRDTAIDTANIESANESVMLSMEAMGAGGARVLNKLSATTRSTRGKVREDVVDMAVASEDAGGRMETMLRDTADVWGIVAFNIEQDIMRIVDALNLLPTPDSVAGIMGAIGAGANHIVNATNNNTAVVNVTNNGAAAAAQTNNFINQVRGFD